MATVAQRRGKWVCDWRDHTGRRRWKTFETKRDAQNHLQTLGVITQDQSEVSTKIKLRDYADRWLQILGARDTKPQSVERYLHILRVHVLPELGNVKVTALTKSRVTSFLTAKAETKTKATAKSCYQVLHNILAEAVHDNLIQANPATGVGKRLKLNKRAKNHVKAFRPEQLRLFLDTTREHFPEWLPLFSTLAWAGLRIGEAQALQWDAVDWQRGQLMITNNLTRSGKLGPPKTSEGHREIDMADALVDTLRQLRESREAQELETGVSSPWVFFPELGTKPTALVVNRLIKRTDYAIAKILKLAGLPGTFTAHSFRHTFASLLLSQGTPIQYVQQAMGHASIQMTADLYGRWLTKVAPGAVNSMVGQVFGSKMVANHPVPAS